MLIEMHCHTAEYSPCSEVPALDLICRARATGLGGVVFTDHHYLWPREELAALFAAAGSPDGLLLLSGQEVSTVDLGDILVFGADRAFPWGLTLAELRRMAPEAALVWAHPFRWGRNPVAGDLIHPALDGVEVLNGNQTDLENSLSCAAWRRYGFTPLAGSDCHDPDAVARYPTRFHLPIGSMEDLVAAIRSGACGPREGDLPLDCRR